MSIAKNGSCILCKCDLNNSYTDAIYFESSSSRDSYFSSVALSTLSGLSYTRLSENKIRVDCAETTAQQTNYCVLVNTDFSTKKYFCFVTDYTYINNNCYEFTFEVDVLTTYEFNYDFRPCFIEREHSATDDIGSHIEPENVDLGDYIVNTKQTLGTTESINLDDMSVIIMIAPDDGTTTSVVDGLAQGAIFEVTSADNPSLINELIAQYQDKPDAIVGIYALPTEVVNHRGAILSQAGRTFSMSAKGITTSTTIDGYTPKNKKLLTYPYNFLEVTNNQGGSLITRFEFFDNMASPHFTCSSCISQPVTLVLNPSQYKKVGLYELESLTLSGYPTLSWKTSTFQQWAGQSATPSVLSALTSALVGTGISIASGGSLAPVALGLLGSATNVMSQGYTASAKANNVRGTVGSGTPLLNANRNHFSAYRLSITAEYAKRIDDYFTRYGYSCCRIKKPNRKNRKSFVYIKTNGCTLNVSNGIPQMYMSKICSIMDNGVTWWREGKTVGDYSQDNTI